MSKRFTALFTFICLIIGLSGCNFSIRDTVESKDTSLPPLRIDSSLVCSVVSIEDNRLFVVILEGNNNYDKGDEIYVTYETVSKDQSVQQDDVITFSYNYVSDVAAIKSTPHILAGEISIIRNYEPPVTEPETTENTTA